MDFQTISTQLDDARKSIELGAYSDGETLLQNVLDEMQQAMSQSTDSDYRDNIAYAHQLRGFAATLQGQYDKALREYSAGLEIGELMQNDFRIAPTNSGIGVVHYNLGNFPLALKHFGISLALQEKLGSMEGIAADAGNIGNIHYVLNDFERASEYFDRVVRIYEQIGNQQAAANTYSSLAMCYQKLGDFDTALAMMTKALETIQEAGNMNSVARILGNLGNLYYHMGKRKGAMEHMQRALELHKQLGNKASVALWTANVGWLCAEKDSDAFNPELSERLIREAMALNTELGVKKELADNYDSLAMLYENTDRYKEALEAYRTYHRMIEEVQTVEAKEAAERQDAAFKLATERARVQATEQVLHRVLPASIADRLTRGEEVADYFQNVSVFFSDIVGFTPMASRMTAHNVIKLLNYVFATFDRIMEKHGCEKIKTIGDGYMAVSGAPIPCDDHAERLARAALEILRETHLSDEIRTIIPEGASFQFRIGLHCGSAFAGIVGENRFVYDVYSDTVNTAARMESHGQPGRVHCSADFANHMKSRNTAFRFEDRGELDIKGKGAMHTCFLLAEN